MKIEIFVSKLSVEYAQRVRGLQKIILNVDMNIDDVYDLAEELSGKIDKQEWSNLREFINALEGKNNG